MVAFTAWKGGRPRGRRGFFVALGLLVALLALPALIAQAGRLFAEESGIPEGLVYVRGGSLLATDGRGGERVLATAPRGAIPRNPVASRDGRALAYSVLEGVLGEPDWGGTLYVVDAPSRGGEAGEPRALLGPSKPGSFVEAGAWSPDGQRLLLIEFRATWRGESYLGTRPVLQVLEVATGKRTEIADEVLDADWSPDGQRIAYVVKQPTGAHSLWTARPDGTGRERVGEEGEFAGGIDAPAYSPDGKRLLFAAVGESTSGAARVGVKQGWRNLAARLLGPSPARAHGIPWDLWISQDGGAPKRLTLLGEDQLSAAWSPDGERIAFVTDLGAYVMRPDGEEVERLEIRAEARGLAWLR